MNQQILLQKIAHRGAERIAVRGPNEGWFNQSIRRIAGATWSATLKTWHVPYTKEAFHMAQSVFPEADLITQDGKLVATNAGFQKETSPESQSLPDQKVGVPEKTILPSGTKEKDLSEKNVVIRAEKKQIFVQMPMDPKDIGFLKKLKYAYWNAKKQCWIVPLYGKNLENIKIWFGNRIKDLHLEQAIKEQVITRTEGKRPPGIMNPDNEAAWEAAKDLLILKGYSPSTRRTYLSELHRFFSDLKLEKAVDFPRERVAKYLVWCSEKLGLKENTIHSRMNALKFYYEQVLGKEKMFFEIPRPKKPKQLPKVISEEKILKTILSVKNLKHRTLLLFSYSCGFRVAEAVDVCIKNIDEDRFQVFIAGGKGKKDRVVPLAQSILPFLKTYKEVYKPRKWLFENQKKNGPYSARSAQDVFKKIAKVLELPDTMSFHSLRHSYATHMLENGIDISIIQKLLGHNDIRTTLRYTHVSNRHMSQIENPLDALFRKKGKKE